MRKPLFVLWSLLPLVGLGYHFGPGQDALRHDRAAAAVKQAEAAATQARAVAAKDGDAAAKGLWAEADDAYSAAIAALGKDKVAEVRGLRLERAKAQMFLGKLPEVRRDLEALVGEAAADPAADPRLVSGARDALANAHYYMTWLMRLEGVPRETWEPEIEASRQTYRLLAEDAERRGDLASAKSAQENLESAVRLARMELKDLQGLPLPSQ